VGSGGWAAAGEGTPDGNNYFGLSVVTSIQNASASGRPSSSVGLTVQEAYNIDKKIDDGFPQSGSVMAFFDSSTCDIENGNTYQGATWAAGGCTTGTQIPEYLGDGPSTAATPGSSITCYDNGNVAE
jgi:hypothetical protein